MTNSVKKYIIPIFYCFYTFSGIILSVYPLIIPLPFSPFSVFSILIPPHHPPNHLLHLLAQGSRLQHLHLAALCQQLLLEVEGGAKVELEAFELVEALEAGELKTIAEGLKEDDNPVLMVVKFKE